MKKILLFLFGLIMMSSVIGQTVASYSFSQPAGTWSPISGGAVIATGGADDTSYGPFGIGFTFSYRGVAQTQFSLNANGFIGFGATVVTSSYTAISSGTSNDVIALVNYDLQGQTTGEIRYQTLGSAPNRTCVVQFLHWGQYSNTGTGLGADWNFQVILYETTNLIDIVYGPFTTNTYSGTYQVGLRGASSADYLNRTTTTNWSATTAGGANTATCTISGTVFPSSGLTFRFTPPPPCVAPVAQPTALVLTAGVTNIMASFTASGSASNYLVVRSLSSTLGATPVNGTVYTVGTVLGSGTVDYYGTGTAYISTGLTSNTRYYFYIFAANNASCSGGPIYLTASPLTGNILTLTTLANLCGNKTVGATGSDYTNLTAAMFALSNSIITCPVSILINASYTSAAEAWPIVVPMIAGSSTTNILTIKPNTGVTATVAGSVAAGMVFKVLNSNTVIDGSNTVGGTTQNLTFQNNSVTTPQVLVIGSTGTTPITNVTLKNTIMINGVNSSSAFILSDGASPGTGGYFNNITIQNNNIQNAYIAMYNVAVAAAGNGSGLLITGNQLNTSGANAIRLCAVYVQGVDGATVSNNQIGNFNNSIDASNITGIWFATSTVNSTISGNTISNIVVGGTAGGPRGIAVSSGVTAANITVTNNTITNLLSPYLYPAMGIYFFSTTTGCNITNNMISNIKNTYSGGYMACGIQLASTAAVAANCNVVNNAIWDIAGYGWSSIYYNYNANGILIYSGFGYNLYYNTVYLNTNQTVAAYPCALFIYSSVTTASAIDLRNNIFDNANTNATQAFAICSQAANTVFSNIDYNDYWSAGPSLGYIASTNQANLAAIQTSFGGNVNSQNIDPTFVGSNLHPTNATLQNKGLFMAGYPTDITGAGRTNPTDIGCYQFAPVQAVVTTAATNVTTANATINGSITAANRTVTSGFDYGLTTAYGLIATGTPPSVSGNTATAITANITGLLVNNTYHFRAKGTNGGLTSYGADMTFSTAVPPVVATTPATIVGATFATLNGTVNPMDASTTLSFDWGLTTTYTGGNLAGTPPTATGAIVVNFNASLTGLVINTTYHYRAKAVNAVGTFYGTDQTFFTTCVVPPTPGSISGPPAVCQNTTGYTYSVSQVPYGFVYNWTFPAGFTITSYPNSNIVTVSVSGTAAAGTISVYASSNCGANSPSSTMAVAVNPLPVPTVSGPSPVCQSANYNYSSQSGKTGYVWTAGDGAITPTSDPSIVTINWPTAGAKTVGVIYTNPATGCTAAAQGTLPVTVNAAPVPTISGNNNLCANSGYYDYTTETGKTNYVWTVSSGGTITGGQGTSLCEIQWTTPGAQTVTVNYNNASGCSAPAATVFNVSVNGIPGAPGAISGPSPVCTGSQGVTYSVPPITNAASYVWTMPAGITIASGAGTNSITVNFSSAAVTGDFTVYGNSICGNGPVSGPLTVTVTQLPVAAGTITGEASVCAGATSVPYSIAPVTNATGYAWTLPAGASIASGDNTPNIIVDFAVGAVSGDISVYGTNSCGVGTASPAYHVTVNPKPAKPTITNHGDTLYSSVQDGNQWFYNGAPISNANGKVFVAHYTGWYWDEIIINSCESDTSNNIYIVVTGVNDAKAASFVVYPVPNDGQFKLQMNSPRAESYNVTVSNSIGVNIYSKQNVMVNGPTDLMIDLRPVSAGVYTMVISNGESKVVKKIIVNR